MDLLLSLSGEKLETLRLSFERHGGELSVSEFVVEMLRLAPNDVLDDRDSAVIATARLVDLFRQVDVDSSETVDWDELTICFASIGTAGILRCPTSEYEFLSFPSADCLNQTDQTFAPKEEGRGGLDVTSCWS